MTIEADPRTLAVIHHQTRSLTGRDLVRPVFRYRRPAVLLFSTLAGLIILTAVLWPPRYTATMKLLVKHERVDPLVTADPDASVQRSEVSEVELNSEVELLKSRDLLEAVAAAAGLVPPIASSATDHDRRLAVARATSRLGSALGAAPVRKTSLIEVTYSAGNPDEARRVLAELSRLYLEKHLSVHRPVGARQFFTEQAARLRRELQDAEQRLVEFGRDGDVVSAASEKEATLQKLTAFEASREDLRAQTADARRRSQALTEAIVVTPARQTTALRTQDNGLLIGDLKRKVLDLELKRTELVRKFNATYPPVLEIEQQLEQARATLDAAVRSPLKEETTDQNPTHQWLRNELSRVQAEYEALKARSGAVEATITSYRARIRMLDEKSAQQQDLTRAVKTAEENYLLYQRKEEEARISDALDRTRIANVVIAEAPTVPSVAASHAMIAGAGLFTAFVLSLVFTFVLEFFNPYFRTRDEVWTVLAVPVLAALPAATTSRRLTE